MGDPTCQLADRLHFVRLCEPRFKTLLLRGLHEMQQYHYTAVFHRSNGCPVDRDRPVVAPGQRYVKLPAFAIVLENLAKIFDGVAAPVFAQKSRKGCAHGQVEFDQRPKGCVAFANVMGIVEQHDSHR